MLLTRCLRGSFPQAPYKSSTLSHCSPVLRRMVTMKRLKEEEMRRTRSDLEAEVGAPRRTARQREDRAARTRPRSSISISCCRLTWQQSIRRGGAVMNPNCSLFTTLQGVSMQICPERYLLYARPNVWTEMWVEISLRQKPWWGDAGIIIHLDKLFILHTALLSAGQSAISHTLLMFWHVCIPVHRWALASS